MPSSVFRSAPRGTVICTVRQEQRFVSCHFQGGNCKLHCDGRKCKRDCFGASGCKMSSSGKEVESPKGNAPVVVSVGLSLLLAAMACLISACEFCSF